MTFDTAQASTFVSRTGDWEAQSDAPRPIGEYLRKLHSSSVRQRFARNTTLFTEGDAAGRVYRIVDGVVRICKHTADGRRHVVDFALAGEIFGYVQNRTHTFTAEAVNDVVAVSYPTKRVVELGWQDADFARLLVTRLHGDLATMQRQLLLLGCHDAKERVASFLLRLAERSFATPGERLDLAMGRQDIADHLGLTVETICRTLRDLKTSGAIKIPNAREVVLNDMRALRAIALAH